MNQGNWELETQNDLGYRQLFDTIWHRRYCVAGVVGGVMAIAIPLALTKKPVYQSYMQVLPESNYQSKEYVGRGNNEFLDQRFTDASVEIDYATQLKVLKSSTILKRVIDKLNLDSSELSEAEIIEALRQSLLVSQLTDEDVSSKSKNGGETKIIQAAYVGSTPEETKRVLEAIRDVYLEYNLEQQEKRLKDGLTFIDAQIPQARQELRRAEIALTKLTREYNVVSPEEEAIAIKENIRNIAQEREAIKAERNQAQANSRSLEKQLGFSSENSMALSRLSQSARYQNLLNRLQEIEIDLADKRTMHADDSPIIQNLSSQRNSQKALLMEEAKIILGEIPPDFINELWTFREQGGFVDSDNQFVNNIAEAQAGLNGLKKRDASLAETESELKQRLTEFPEVIAQYNNLSQEQEIKRTALQKLLEAKQELEIELSRGGFNWQVIEPPQLGLEVGGSLAKDLLLSLVVASFLGVSTAFIREAMDERISHLKEVGSKTALPILGSTPALTLPASNRFVTKIPFLSSHQVDYNVIDVVQWQPFREALDVIYENLRLSGLTSTFNSLAITSSISGEGKSTFTLGLALSAARHQQKVLIIDADLRNPSLHRTFDLPSHSGLADFLLGETDVPHIQQVSLLGENIELIPSGSRHQDPVKLLSSSQLSKLIEQYAAYYDLILVDTPPAIGRVDAVKIASICDSALLMMRLDKIKSSELLETEALLSKLNILGVVANDSKEYEIATQNLLPQQV